MLTNLNEFCGDYILHVCRDGTVTVRHTSEPVFNGVALPFFKTTSREQAEMLIVITCCLQKVRHPLLGDKPWYVFPNFGGELEDMSVVQLAFQNALKLIGE